MEFVSGRCKFARNIHVYEQRLFSCLKTLYILQIFQYKVLKFSQLGRRYKKCITRDGRQNGSDGTIDGDEVFGHWPVRFFPQRVCFCLFLTNPNMDTLLWSNRSSANQPT